jgi:hypothetical protein
MATLVVPQFQLCKVVSEYAIVGVVAVVVGRAALLG